MTVDEQRRRLGGEQIEALFGSILIATAAASATRYLSRPVSSPLDL
jgi:hypothetical protein